MALPTKYKILIAVTSVLALGGVGYFIYAKRKEKKMAEIYKRSIDEMVKKYDVFNNPQN